MLLHSCSRAKRLDLAENCMSLMRLTGVRTNIITYNSIVDACAEEGDVIRAFWWWVQEMI